MKLGGYQQLIRTLSPAAAGPIAKLAAMPQRANKTHHSRHVRSDINIY